MDYKTLKAARDQAIAESLIEKYTDQIYQFFYENKITSKHAISEISRCARDLMENTSTSMEHALTAAMDQYYEHYNKMPSELDFCMPVQKITKAELEEKYPVYKVSYGPLLTSAPKCECGAESLGYTTHSYWCVRA